MLITSTHGGRRQFYQEFQASHSYVMNIDHFGFHETLSQKCSQNKTKQKLKENFNNVSECCLKGDFLHAFMYFQGFILL